MAERLKLPFAPVAEGIIPVAGDQVGSGEQTARPTVIFVDDLESDLMKMRLYAERAGYNVLTESTVQGAIDLFNRVKKDKIAIDRAGIDGLYGGWVEVAAAASAAGITKMFLISGDKDFGKQAKERGIVYINKLDREFRAKMAENFPPTLMTEAAPATQGQQV